MHRRRLAIIFCTFKVILSNLRQILPRIDIPPCFFFFFPVRLQITQMILPMLVLYYALQLLFMNIASHWELYDTSISFQNSSVFYVYVWTNNAQNILSIVKIMHKIILPTVHKLSAKSKPTVHDGCGEELISS